MGLPYAHIRVENLFSKRTIEARALVDSGAVFMILPQHLAVQFNPYMPVALAK